MKSYDFGPGHPFRDDRYTNFMRLLREKATNLEVIEPRYASDEEILLVHDKSYVYFLEGISKGIWLSSSRFFSTDTLPQPGIEKGARLIVGASFMAGELVWEKRFAHMGCLESRICYLVYPLKISTPNIPLKPHACQLYQDII